jgi:hypothetical protein
VPTRSDVQFEDEKIQSKNDEKQIKNFKKILKKKNPSKILTPRCALNRRYLNSSIEFRFLNRSNFRNQCK